MDEKSQEGKEPTKAKNSATQPVPQENIMEDITYGTLKRSPEEIARIILRQAYYTGQACTIL